ncbi:uncharacterized protein LOC115716449 isoform X1 [Cannabis sativa]|uniref:uncharacterized protein LOC115716449 isoform X1 n=1 Tax=Cannabis sativa TaxID=3483 RepID=UPI0011DFD921|nr:uncharacterized protein LOC115716449 isoform X1 [Cannabis sativa]
MEDKKRWSVTYTRHMKQKRKVYQDGFLVQHTSTNKLSLYDECEKLLECKVLKNDEVVSCGESLTFNSFLIDVNDAEGDHEVRSDLNSIGRNSRRDEKSKSQQRQSLSLSPSQKIIRDFKKREVRKYVAIQSQRTPDITKSSITEWEAMYTTQLTQKSKKFHDGFVQLEIRGSMGRQLMLLDESKSTLDSKFLKKDEKIESGATISFDAHLVRIGEPQGDHKSFGGSNSNVERETGIMNGQRNYGHGGFKTAKEEFVKSEFKSGASHNSQDTTQSSSTEWQVMYTSQLTQKSKKFHDGFLRLANSGSCRKRGMLYDETRNLLNSGFLKRDEVVRTGVSFVFDAYLVEIGQPDENNEPIAASSAQENCCEIVKDIEKMHRQQSSLAFNKSALKDKPSGNPCLRKATESDISFSAKIDSKESGSTATTNPLRNARQILSFLQKPRIQNNVPVDNKNTTPTKEPLLANAADMDFPEHNKTPELSVLHDQSSESVDAMESKEHMDLKKPFHMSSEDFAAISSGDDSQLLNDNNDNGTSHLQLKTDKMDIDSKQCDEALCSDMPCSSTTSCGPIDAEKNCSVDNFTCAWDVNECPSFDLGIF